MSVDEIVLFMAQQGKCFYCDLPIDTITYPQSNEGYTRDHFNARCKGNSITGNKVLAHRLCNEKKDARSPTQSEIDKFNDIQKIIKSYFEFVELYIKQHK